MNLIKIYSLITGLIIIAFISSNLLSSSFSIRKGEVIPLEDQREALIGKWEVDFKFRNTADLLEVEGIVTFRDDSTFVDALSYTYYEGTIYGIEKRNDIKQTGKAIRYGKIIYTKPSRYSNTGFLVRTLDHHNGSFQCFDQINHPDYDPSYDFCSEVFGALNFFGDVDLHNGKTCKILIFTESKIVVRVTLQEVMDPIFITYKKIKS